MKSTHALVLTLLASLAILAFLGAGCNLGKPNSASFASVEIKDSTMVKIRDTTVAVFQEDGYTTVGATTNAMVFEEEGTRMDKFAYGEWVDGGSVYIRVKTFIVPLQEGAFRLQCIAYMVTDHGSIMEEEQRLTNARARPWQRLLDKVKDRLKK